MNANDFLKRVLQDVKVDASQHFDRNFERKAFFNQKWPTTSMRNRRGSLMMRTGALRRSIRSNVQGSQIVWKSSLPYAAIHNEGGEIIVTEKMKKFFWAMYYKSSGAILFNVKKKAMANTERNRKLSTEAEQWKALALQKTGEKMKIQKRQFIGEHPIVKEIVIRVVNNNLKEINEQILKASKQ
ncbi:phage virion morphogenesis protein [Flavobacterium columnare]|uniref:Uncharacterized protein n=2 Tax=Flavobacterium columnare TaxID=996 RepID=A0AA94F3M8_9FLAO|nr:phage virion morphogenesis protein [Flavobacterium columnare]MCH4829797.1 phage virion morphogenesis protein [Flavobacterium columnare]MCH4831596.1 phage virion morphogenesis protein [Flavobacterium columnare]MCH4831626.1 phage virion morphogenesis protein [Flavobacterium columnare]MCH4831663.1 phage virion morphogenesis protein [Flavobacterium columnare]MCH4832825.1 phage virion morphogenesis protein [Flavobacterium columnare]